LAFFRGTRFQSFGDSVATAITITNDGWSGTFDASGLTGAAGISGNGILYLNPFAPYATGSRPTVSASGTSVYDTTLKKPIWWNSADGVWKDAEGSTV
jgi:hypothetical protein